jgi:hypothetical protein
MSVKPGTSSGPLFKSEQVAFKEAIELGHLSRNIDDETYFRLYRYLGHFDGLATFKHQASPRLIEFRDGEAKAVIPLSIKSEEPGLPPMRKAN